MNKFPTLSFIAPVLILLWLPTPGSADTFTVDRTDDPFPAGSCSDQVASDCSLREAINRANASPGGDIIMIPAGTYVLSRKGIGEDAGITGDLDISEAAFLQGAGMGATIIDADGLGDRVINIFSADGTEIHDLTIRGGTVNVTEGGGGLAVHSNVILDTVNVTSNLAEFGGGVFNASGKVMTIRGSIIDTNRARVGGGGILNAGTLTINDTTVVVNEAHHGGGIRNEAMLTINDTAINENTADEYGGGINNIDSLTIHRSVIQANVANQGGGIDNSSGQLWVTDSTISDNEADYQTDTGGFGGGGILHFSGTAVLERTSVVANQAIGTTGGGIWNRSALEVADLTIEGNHSNVDGAAIYQVDGYFSAHYSTISGHSGGTSTILHSENGNLNLFNTTISGNTTTTAEIIRTDSGGILTNQLTFFDNDASLVSEIFANGSTFKNSIIQGSCGGTGPYTSDGGNVMGPQFGCGIDQPTDLDFIDDMMLGPLQDNGGLTWTHLPLEGSPVIDRILPAECDFSSTDQRGLPRQVDLIEGETVCDSGAVEVQPEPLPDEILTDSFETKT